MGMPGHAFSRTCGTGCPMALEVYFREDIQQGIIASVLVAIKTYAANEGENTDYLQGMLDLAQAQAALYGLSWPAIQSVVRESLSTGVRELMDRALPDSRKPLIAARTLHGTG
jgi:hypothetical protein